MLLLYCYKGDQYTVRRFYFATAEVRFMFSSSFRKLGLAFNLEYLCQFFIKFNDKGQTFFLLVMRIQKLSLIIEIHEELTEIFKVKGKAQFPKSQ